MFEFYIPYLIFIINIECKIYNSKLKGKIGLSRHLKFSHNKNFINYMIEYEDLKIPKCICEKKCKYKDGLIFLSTCGDKKCIKKNTKRKKAKIYERKS